jgi:hypothetical protein
MWAAIILKLFRTTASLYARVAAPYLVTYALVRILKSPPSAHVIDQYML